MPQWFQSAVAHELFSDGEVTERVVTPLSWFQSAVAHELFSDDGLIVGTSIRYQFQSAVAHELFSDSYTDLCYQNPKLQFQSAVAHELFSDGAPWCVAHASSRVSKRCRA